MNVPLINDVAQQIRIEDGGNKLTSAELAWALTSSPLARAFAGVPVADLIVFLERTNPDKTVGAGALAELIVAEFGLDTEARQ